MPVVPPPAVNIERVEWPPPTGGNLGIVLRATFSYEAGDITFTETGSRIAMTVNQDNQVLVDGSQNNQALEGLIQGLNADLGSRAPEIVVPSQGVWNIPVSRYNEPSSEGDYTFAITVDLAGHDQFGNEFNIHAYTTHVISPRFAFYQAS